MASNSTPLSLRPWPTDTGKPKALAEFIARVNSQGEFRNVTEASLRKQIEEEENGTVGSADVEMRDESEAEDEAVDTVATAPTVEEIRKAQEEVFRQIDVAHNAALITQDFVSLLLSKENPVQASTTLSQALRDLVGIGTMGADKVVDSNMTGARLLDNKNIATGWKLLDLDKTIDSLMSSASRLEKEIELETKYWADVLAVKDHGWAVSRLSNQSNSLGVKFGFSESSPNFRNNSFAPMKRADDGSVLLDVSQAENPQRVLVTIQKKGHVVGRSSLAPPLASDAPLQNRVLEARNTIFEQELWHEINREGRALLSYNVRLEPSSVVIRTHVETSIIITLESPDTYERFTDEKRTEDGYAEKISSGIHLLLTYAHRLNKQKRSQPKPLLPAPSQASTPAYAILRPFLGYLAHEHSITQIVTYFSSLTSILHSTGLTHASYTFDEKPLTLSNPNAPHWVTPPELLCNMLLSPQNFSLTLTITPTARLQVRARTMSGPICTQFLVAPLQPLPGGPWQNPTGIEEPRILVAETFPPAPDAYPDLREVTYYIRQIVARVLAQRAVEMAQVWSKGGAEEGPWRKMEVGYRIENDAAEVEFVLSRASEKINNAKEWDQERSKRGNGMRVRGEYARQDDLAGSGNVDADLTPPMLVVYTARPVGTGNKSDAAGEGTRTGMWVWRSDGEGEGTVDEVVRGCIAGAPVPDAIDATVTTMPTGFWRGKLPRS